MTVDSRDIGGRTEGDLMNAEIQGKLDAIKAPIQGMLDAADAIPALVDQAELVSYNKGVEDGKAMIVLPDPTNPDNIYTQAQMDEAVSNGKAQQKSEDDVVISDLSVKLSALQTSYDAAALECEALKAKYDDLVAKVKAANADDAALIAGL